MTLNAEVAEVHGLPLAEEQLGALTLGGFLREVCAKHADKEALVFYPASGPVIRKTYADVWRESFAIARALMTRPNFARAYADHCASDMSCLQLLQRRHARTRLLGTSRPP